MFIRNQKGRIGRVIFLTSDLLTNLRKTKGEMLSDLSKDEVYHDRLSYREMALVYKLNLEMYKILSVYGKPFTFTDKFNELEKASFYKLLSELEDSGVIGNLLSSITNYSILKLGKDLVFLLDDSESLTEEHKFTSFTKLGASSLLEAILEGVVNQLGYFETHLQQTCPVKENEFGIQHVYRAMLLSK